MKSSIKTGILNAALVWGIMILTAASMPVLAAVPELINFQGKLTDLSDKAVTSVVPMVFKLYATATGGSPIWTETQAVTPDNEGVYSVMLGEVAPFDISFSTAYWLGVKVGADSEMLPRYRMVSSAYSLYALNSATSAWAGGADWLTITNRSTVTTQGNVFNGPNQLVQVGGDGFLPVLNGSNLTGLPDTVIADGAVTTAKLAANAVTDAKVLLSTAAITSGKFGDERVAIGTQAVSGGIYNLAGKLVQLGGDGFLPVLNGSNLINITKAQVGLDNVSNEAQIAKVIGTTKGDVIVFSGSAIPVRMAVGTDGQIIMADSVQASGVKWAAVPSAPVSTVFGRSGAVVAQSGDYTAAQVGLGNVSNDAQLKAADLDTGPLATNSDAKVPSQKAVKTYADTKEAADISIVKEADFTATDFSVALGVVSLNYGSGEAANATTKGFLTASDWSAFNGKQAVITGGATTIDTENLDANLALVSDGSGKVGVSAVSNTELGYVGGVTSAIQTQLNGKAVRAATQTFTGGNTFTSTAAFTAQNASVPGITISSGLIVSAGNVGIGTIVPTSTLTVVGTFKLVDGSQGLSRVLTSDADGLASWQPGGGGDVYLASTQTFTGQNTFISTVTAKGFVNTSQYVTLGGVTTFAANGSGVVLMTLTAANPIATIGGCSEGTVGQGQMVTFVVATWATDGAVSFTDTPSPPTADNILLLHTTAGIWIPPAAATSLGATMTLLCTTVNSHKVWVEIGRSNATD